MDPLISKLFPGQSCKDAFESLGSQEQSRCFELGLRLHNAYKFQPTVFISMIDQVSANCFPAEHQVIIDIASVKQALSTDKAFDVFCDAYVRLGTFFLSDGEQPDLEQTSSPKNRKIRDHLYLIANESEKVCKIGRSKDPEGRVRALAVGSHSELKLICWFKHQGRLEKQLHNRLLDYRIKGEWFDDCILSIVDWKAIEGYTEAAAIRSL